MSYAGKAREFLKIDSEVYIERDSGMIMAGRRDVCYALIPFKIREEMVKRKGEKYDLARHGEDFAFRMKLLDTREFDGFSLMTDVIRNGNPYVRQTVGGALGVPA